MVTTLDKFVSRKGKHYLNGKELDPEEDKELIDRYLKEAAIAIADYEELAMMGLE